MLRINQPPFVKVEDVIASRKVFVRWQAFLVDSPAFRHGYLPPFQIHTVVGKQRHVASFKDFGLFGVLQTARAARRQSNVFGAYCRHQQRRLLAFNDGNGRVGSFIQ